MSPGGWELGGGHRVEGRSLRMLSNFCFVDKWVISWKEITGRGQIWGLLEGDQWVLFEYYLLNSRYPQDIQMGMSPVWTECWSPLPQIPPNVMVLESGALGK